MKVIPVMTIPKVARSLAPCLSESQPLTGPVIKVPMDRGIMNIPAHNGVTSKL